ncbi:hypothetical protein ACXR0O_22265 [Verrucomicrobiota bacterium sgz303538]
MAAQVYTLDLDAPTIDKWQYPFGGTGATRASASTFGAVGVGGGFDDRDAEFFNAFDTTGLVPKGLGASSYVILSATFTLSLAPGPSGSAPDLIFDGTYDPVSSYGAGGDSDPGRPMELFGAAFRNGYTSGTITDSTPFANSSSPEGIPGPRNIYPTDFFAGGSINGSNRDVSNNVTNGFDVNPFAIGQVAPGDLTNGKVDEDADIVFTLNLANPDVLRYLQLSLDEGRISFLVTSLHQASQGGAADYPIYYTKENLLGGSPARLDLQVQVVPEPSAVATSLLGFGVFVALWRGGRGLQDEEVLS